MTDLYRVTTHYELPGDRPGKRTEILQMRYAVASRIANANGVAKYDYSRGRMPSYFVLAEKLVNDEWLPIDCLTGMDQFFTCDQTYETKSEWDARHA